MFAINLDTFGANVPKSGAFVVEYFPYTNMSIALKPASGLFVPTFVGDTIAMWKS